MALEGQQIPAGSSPTTVSAPTVTIALDDYHKYRGLEQEFATFKAQQAAEVAAKERERLDALAESGKWKQSLEETRTSYDKQLNESNGRYAQLEQQVFGEKTQTVLAQALAGRTFNGANADEQTAVAGQLLSILAPQFETSRSADGSFQTRHKVSGRPATDVLKEALASPAYAHFFVPSNRGGAGSDATRSLANPQITQPNSLDAIEQDFFRRQGQWAGIGLGGAAGQRQGG